MQVIASHRVIAPSRAALASKPVRSLRRASGSVARRSADRVILSTRAMAEEGAAVVTAPDDSAAWRRLGALGVTGRVGRGRCVALELVR